MKLRHYEMRHKHLSLFPARERIIDALLLTAYKFGKSTDEGLEISVCTSRKEIASFANTSTEKAIRTLSLLRSEKHIVIQGKKIIIQDPNFLINQLTQYLYNTDEPTNVNLGYPNLFY